MRNNIKSFITGIALLGLAASQAHSQKPRASAPGAPTRPNLILIMSDDQGWGDMGYNGHPYLQTPNLDRMAREGARFNRAYSGSAVCSPTRASFLTGRNPERMGICFANCGHLKKEEITLYELAKPAGYTTGHFGKWHLGTLSKTIPDANRGGNPEFFHEYAPPWEHGVDVSFVTESKVPTWDPMKTPLASAMEAGNKPPGSPFGTHYWTGEGQIATDNLEGDDSRVMMDRVLPFIDQAVRDKKPFLTVIWFHTPHLPVYTGEKYKKPYAGLSEDQQEFYGAITAMDEQIGRLRAHLTQLGIADHTIISFTSDNGPEGKEPIKRTQGLTYGLNGRKRSLKEGGIRVPGLLVWPGQIPAGTVVNAPVFTSDYFPTIASLLNVDLDKFNRPYDGTDLRKVMREERPAIPTERYLSFLLEGQAAHIGTRYKLYRENETAEWQLFDLLTDPGETSNIASKKPDLNKQLIAGWSDWEKSVKNSAAGHDYQP
jgi:arylsulfatase A-like enzyme